MSCPLLAIIIILRLPVVLHEATLAHSDSNTAVATIYNSIMDGNIGNSSNTGNN